MKTKPVKLKKGVSGGKAAAAVLTMGISMLVDVISNGKPPGATESTVFGPFYREGGPEMPEGANIAEGGFESATSPTTAPSTDAFPRAASAPESGGRRAALEAPWVSTAVAFAGHP